MYLSFLSIRMQEHSVLDGTSGKEAPRVSRKHELGYELGYEVVIPYFKLKIRFHYINYE